MPDDLAGMEDEFRKALKDDTMDKYLLEAMREVDAMLPGTPTIAPVEVAAHVKLTHQERHFARMAGVTDLDMARMIANAAPSRVEHWIMRNNAAQADADWHLRANAATNAWKP